MPPDTALRRRDDRMIADMDKRLALVEQARILDGASRDAHFRALESSIGALAAKVEQALGYMQTASAEPGASPAGRLVSAEIADLRKTVDLHDDFVQQMTGALRLARFALGTSFLAVIGNIVMALMFLGGTR